MVEQNHAAVQSVSSQLWRDVLNAGAGTPAVAGRPTKRGNRAQTIGSLLGPCFSDRDLVGETPHEVTWYSTTMEHIPPTIIRQVLWEISELSFRFELLMLDRVLRPRRGPDPHARDTLVGRCFSLDEGEGCRVSHIPSRNVALASNDLRGRGRLLERLRRVFLSWPNCPPVLQNAFGPDRSDSINVAQEEVTMRFYSQTFFDYCGRAPVLPRRVV